MAQDATPAEELLKELHSLRMRWSNNIDASASKLGEYFAQAVQDRSDKALKQILRDAGFSVQFQMTPLMRDVLEASIGENIGLIKSIPSQYFDKVETIVMKGVTTGYDLHQISGDLIDEFGVTKKRAALISRDQANKANAVMTRARQVELGIRECIWVHSGAGKTRRRSHVQASRDKVRYNIFEGWYDPDEDKFILPGVLIGCRCVARPVVPGI